MIGVATTGVVAFSGQAVAQELEDFSIEDEPDSVQEVEDASVEIEEGNPNPVFEELDIEIEDGEYDVDDDSATGTMSGEVTGTVLENANENAANGIDTEFDDAPFSLDLEENDVNGNTELLKAGGSVELARLVIEDLFLDVLGLEITLDVLLVIEADPEGGLLGRLLADLLG